MSRHNRQRNKRVTRHLLAVFNKMCQKEPWGARWSLCSLVELIQYRLENTGKFPRYITVVQREAYKRFGIMYPITQR